MTQPLFNGNRLKLGLFGLNAGHHILTRAPERYVVEWDRCSAIVAQADRIGLEAIVSLAGWGAPPELEPFTWAAALGARYAHPAYVSTMHVQLNHPTFVAKAATTASEITHGRFALNIVAGANPDTYRAFGVAMEDHETRYAHAAEFLVFLRRLWTEDEPFDFEGRFYRVKAATSMPKPRYGIPPIMNAGTSERGRRFAVQYADLVFTHLEDDIDAVRTQIRAIKALAASEFRREVQVWTHGYTVVRETQAEAEAFLKHYAIDYADREKVERWVAALGASAQSSSPDERWKFERNWAAGGGVELVGSADRVTTKLIALCDAGLDGILLNSIEPETMLEMVGREVLPRLEQAGLRRAASATAR